jgi:signal peptidase I
MSQPTNERNFPLEPSDSTEIKNTVQDGLETTSSETVFQSEAAPVKPTKPRLGVGQYLWKEWVRPIGEAVIIAVFVTTFIFTTVAIQGNSDQPNVFNNERVFVPKYETWLHKLGVGSFQRGDLVVLKPPQGSPSSVKPMPIISNFVPSATYRPYFIKRIVGVSGDRIRLVKGQLYVNDIKVEETHTTSYWKAINNWDKDSGLASSDEWYFRDEKERAKKTDYVVPKGQFFVMGDNRSIGGSEDSRVFGPVKLDDFSGRAVFVWWPPVAQVKTITAKASDGHELSWDRPLESDYSGKLEDAKNAQFKMRLRVLSRPEAFVKLNKQLAEQAVKTP